MSLIDPGPRSATVKALADTECFVTTYDAFLASAQTDPERTVELMQTLVRRLRKMNERMTRVSPEMGHRIQQWLHVILAGLDEHEALSGAEMETLQRELRMLLQIERFQIASVEIEQGRAGARLHAAPEHRGVPEPLVRQVRGDRPGDLEPLRRRRGAGVARALRPLGAQRRAPAPAGGARDHARPVPPQHVPRHARDVRRATRAASRWSSAACASASGRGSGRSSGCSSASRSPIPRRSRTSTSAWRSGAGRWRSWRRTTRSTPSTRSSTAMSPSSCASGGSPTATRSCTG